MDAGAAAIGSRAACGARLVGWLAHYAIAFVALLPVAFVAVTLVAPWVRKVVARVTA
ncbi:MAG: hypothetical protein IT479_11690 [Xanthomonadales bacterium]|nr:hypothetical protein [Xanthomonadales bacterium]MCC6593924.1 hypothetical protein [Xanthomonadales bacterium]